MATPNPLAPFHQQAEDVGTFVIRDRARDAEHQPREDTREDKVQGPSENAD
jgi:hypothetical protein